MEEDQRSQRRILTHWPRHRKQKQKFWLPWPQQKTEGWSRETTSSTPNTRQERTCLICSGPHWPQCPEKQGKSTDNKNNCTHTAYSDFARALHKVTSMFAREAVETRKALIYCGASRSVGVLARARRSGTHEMRNITVLLVFPWAIHRRHGTLSRTVKDNRAKER